MALTGIIKVYIALVKSGRRTIDEVPKNIREDVQKLLESEE